MSTPSHDSPTEELSWFSVTDHRPRRQDPAGPTDPPKGVRTDGDAVDGEGISRRAGEARLRRPNRGRFQLRGH